MSIPFFSVIIPVYNADFFLEDCVESVLKQTFSDYEVLLVNDGSTDNSLELCEELTRKSKRVKTFSKINGGVSSARNLGIDQANGEYIVFIDPDDSIKSSLLEKVHQFLSMNPSDIVFFNFFVQGHNGSYVHHVYSSYTEGKVLTKEEAIESVLSGRGYQGFSWNKVYSRNILNEIRFNSNIFYLEDALFCIDAINSADKVSCMLEPLYIYRQHENSLVHKSRLNYKQLTYFDALSLIGERIPIVFLNELLLKKKVALLDFSGKVIGYDRDEYIVLKKAYKESGNCIISDASRFEKLVLSVAEINYLASVMLLKIKNKIIKTRIFPFVKNLLK